MTIPEQIKGFLEGHRSDCFCDDCIQEQLKLARRQEVAPVTKTLGLTLGFQRDHGVCVLCSHPRTKLVIRAI
jgi:hypothetical protein